MLSNYYTFKRYLHTIFNSSNENTCLHLKFNNLQPRYNWNPVFDTTVRLNILANPTTERGEGIRKGTERKAEISKSFNRVIL